MIRTAAQTLLAFAVIFCAYAEATRNDDAQEVGQVEAVRAERAAHALSVLGVRRLAAK